LSLDKFYTKENVALHCLKTLDIVMPNVEGYLEPSAGSGSFLKFLPKDTVSLDIEPNTDVTFIQSFYDFYPDKNDFITVGNPPFGRVNKEAVKFFNHAAKFSKVIAFIVPRTFKRVSVQNRLDLSFHLIYQENIPIGSFIPESMKAKCVWQIWEKRDYKREKVILESTHPDFDFVSPDEASIAIKAYGGSGDCGTIEYTFDGLNPKAYHFIKCSKEVIANFKKITYYPLASDTVRQDSIGRKELIYLYKNIGISA
jgi:hypothetical protein